MKDLPQQSWQPVAATTSSQLSQIFRESKLGPPRASWDPYCLSTKLLGGCTLRYIPMAGKPQEVGFGHKGAFFSHQYRLRSGNLVRRGRLAACREGKTSSLGRGKCGCHEDVGPPLPIVVGGDGLAWGSFYDPPHKTQNPVFIYWRSFMELFIDTAGNSCRRNAFH